MESSASLIERGTDALLECTFCDAAHSLEHVRRLGAECATSRGGCGRLSGFAQHVAWDRALDSDPLRAQVADPIGHTVKLGSSTVARLSQDLRNDFTEAKAREKCFSALEQVLRARKIPLSAPSPDADDAEASFELNDNTLIIQRPEAFVARCTLPNGGRREWPVLSRPLRMVKWHTVEGEQRVVMEDPGGRFSGTFGDAYRRLRENGQVLDPKNGERVLARLKTDAPFAGDAPATFGLIEQAGRLVVPAEFYPRPGHQADAIRDVEPNLNERPQPEGWKAWRTFFSYYHAREWMPLAGLAAIAPAALILRTARIVVPAAYAYSRQGGTGKTTLSSALSEQAYGLEAVNGEAANSEFRFLGMLDAACLPRLVDEAERLDWNRYGAVLKAAMGAPRAGDRGKKDRTIDAYKSRAVPFFTSNARPPLSPPVLTRFLMLQFDEERKRNTSAETERAFRRAVEQLPAAGLALAAALVKLYPTSAALLGRHRELADSIGKARGSWDDTRRPGAWAVVYLGLEAWAEASGAAVEAPPIERFVREVVEPVELATFEEPVDALDTLRGWLEVWSQRNPGQNALTGPARVEVKDSTRVTGVRFIEARLVTKPLIDLYNRDMEKRPDVQFTGLKRVASEVQSQFGAAELLDADGQPRLYSMPNGTRQRAVPLPLEAPGTPHLEEGAAQ